MNLDDFIQQRSRGGKLDSTGDFAVDGLAALRKTLSSALPEPHYYFYQILQSLILSKASDIRVAIGRGENKITFVDSEQAFSDLEALSARFGKGLSVSSNHHLDLLMSGMTTSLGDHMAKAELHHGAQRLSVSHQGVSITQLSTAVKEPYIVVQRNIEKGLSFSWSRIWGARKEEFRIRKAFEHSPIPLSIAGLPTTPHSSWRRGLEGADHFALVEAAVLASGSANHCGETQADIRRADGSKCLYHCSSLSGPRENAEHGVAPNLMMLAMDESGDAIERELGAQDWEHRLWTFCFTSLTEEPSEMLFIRNGFRLARHRIDLGYPGLEVVAPADDLTVDAGGYQLVENEVFASRVEQGRFLASRVVEILQTEDLSALISQTGRDPSEVLGRFEWCTLSP